MSRDGARTATVRKGYVSGTHRLVPPEETIARTRAHWARMGITRLANVTGLDTIGIPVVMAIRPSSRSLSVAQGKGLTLDAAKASALMESIEGYHAERITLPLRLMSYREIRAEAPVVDVDLLPRVIDSPYHGDRPILWVEGEDWRSGQRLWVPYQTVHTAYTAHMSFDLGTFHSSTAGLASGNHLLEAVSHGICEIVERDATLLASLESATEIDRRKVALDTVDHADCRALLDRLERAGMMVGVWETTRDILIPSFQCVIVDREHHLTRGRFVAGGAGCHPARHIALLRAITEAAQSRLTGISGSRDDLLRSRYRDIQDPGAVAEQCQKIERQGSRSFQSAPSHDTDDLDLDVAWELFQLEKAGLEQVIVVDLTKPEIGVPVARVIVPGLESAEEADSCAPGPRMRRRSGVST